MRRGVIVFAVFWVCPPVLGQTLVGPSTAVLEGSRFGLSAEYSQADADVTFEVDWRAEDNFDFQTAFACFSAALTSRWDFFVRLGGSQAEAPGFDGDWDISWGMGTRFTALQWRALRWGVLAQVTNLVSDFDTVGEFLVDDTPTLLDTTEELNLLEYVLATGPTWRQGPLSVYGGLLLRYVDGEFETIANDFRDRSDVHAQWDVGGYVGGQWTLFQIDPARTCGVNRCDLTAEGRFTGDSTGFSVGLLLPFGGAY